MFHNVRVAVIEKTEGDRVPWTEDGIQRRERVLFGGDGPKPSPGPTQPTSAAEVVRVCREVEAMTSLSMLGVLERQHAGTPAADCISARIGELKAAQAVAAQAAEGKKRAEEVAARAKSEAERQRLAMLEQQRQDEARKAAETVAARNRSEAASATAPGTVFRDCPDCPEMVVVPAGQFTMGSLANEPQRDSDEAQVRVSIARPFAVGKFAVTFDEWDACVAGGGCNGYRPDDRRWGRGTRPVINVNWDDAKAYTAWLSKKTGKTYRLPSEAEREYVARAGTTTPFWWGTTISTAQANYDGSHTYGGGAKGEFRGRTMPVDSFKANPWGLYNVHGNVWEWTEDCWNDTNTGNPGDGRARTSGDCSRRVVRGGSWGYFPQFLRSANREGDTPDDRSDSFGFRLARTLNP